MLKKIYSTLGIGLLLCSFAWNFQSCNFLDIDPYITDMQSLDTVFQKKEQTLSYLYGVYSYLLNPGKTWGEGGAPWVPVSDECFGTYKKSSYPFNYFANNEMNTNDEYYNYWGKYYQGIRSASVFLKRVYECKELNAMELQNSIGEAEFLRAYYYFELMKQYGPVCLVPEEGFALDMPIDQILIPRNTWDECVEFVASELKKAARDLPPFQTSSDFGKPTSATAYAVLSRLLLYNASPLFNGNASYAGFVNKKNGKPYINQEYKDEKWAQAAAAAKKVIDNPKYSLFTVIADEDTPDLPEGIVSDPDFYQTYPNGAAGIDHYKSYGSVFNGSVVGSENPELLFGMPNLNVDLYMAPLKMYGVSCFNMTQKLVDAYYMADGTTGTYTDKELDQNISFSGYQLRTGVYGWFVGREMRFYASVGFSGSYYLGTSGTQAATKNFQAEFFKGGNCDKNQNKVSSDANSYCMTGYLCRKFQHPEDCYSSGNGIVRPKVWCEYRLAEIYLNYVEALNELKGSYTVDGETFTRDKNEIVKYFNLIRYRAGLPGITLEDAADYTNMRNLIRRERQIELAWEGHRYFDVRRWKLLEEEENGPVRGLNVNRKKNDDFYRVVDLKEVAYANKTYSPRKYFWPIPQSEITKNTNLDQNPWW